MRDLLKARSAANLSASISAAILDLRRPSVAISASTLDLLSAASVATRDAASSAASLDLLSPSSTST